MSVLAFGSSAPRSSSTLSFYDRGDYLIELSTHARAAIFAIADVQTGRLETKHTAALLPLQDIFQCDCEIGLLLDAIRRHDAVYLRVF